MMNKAMPMVGHPQSLRKLSPQKARKMWKRAVQWLLMGMLWFLASLMVWARMKPVKKARRICSLVESRSVMDAMQEEDR